MDSDIAAWIMRALIASLFLKIIGWTVVGEKPTDSKYVYVFAPHTSNLDFCLGLASSFVFGIHTCWVAKHTLFFWPLGVFLRHYGGIPINRKAPKDIVSQIVSQFNKNSEFAFGMAPEGTRKKTLCWKSGFYRIAMGAKVPVYLVFADYKRREVGIGPKISLTGDPNKDMEFIRGFYQNKVAKYPEKVGPITLRVEEWPFCQ